MNIIRKIELDEVRHVISKPVDMGEVNGVRLTYVDGNVFATPKLGKPKPEKQARRKRTMPQSNRSILEKQIENIVKAIVFWRDGQQCVESRIDGGRCGNGLQWGHFVPRSQSGWLKYTLATFCQCGSHNNLHDKGAVTMGVWFAQTFGTTALQMMDEIARAMVGKKRTIDELRDLLAHYDELYQNRFYVDLQLPALVAAGYYGEVIRDAWKKEGKI